MNTTSGRIIVGIDDPKRAGYTAALRYAADEATRRHASVKLVHGCQPRWGVTPANLSTSQEHLERGQQLLLKASDALKRIAKDVSIEVSCTLAVGIDALLEESEKADLVVLQRRDIPKLHRLAIGSTTSTLAARSACPVVITHADQRTTSWGVVVGVDDSGHSMTALKTAFSEASWRKTPLTVVHAWQLLYNTPYYGYIPPDPGERRAARSEAECLVAEAVAGYSDLYPEVTVRRHVVEGNPADVLLDQSSGKQLLVVARHSNLPAGSLALGSIARSMIENSPAPVMVTATERPHRDR